MNAKFHFVGYLAAFRREFPDRSCMQLRTSSWMPHHWRRRARKWLWTQQQWWNVCLHPRKWLRMNAMVGPRQRSFNSLTNSLYHWSVVRVTRADAGGEVEEETAFNCRAPPDCVLFCNIHTRLTRCDHRNVRVQDVADGCLMSGIAYIWKSAYIYHQLVKNTRTRGRPKMQSMGMSFP